MTDSRVGQHLAALVVPFKANLEIDQEGLRAVCRHMLTDEGIDGIVVNAHAGEVDTLTTEERELVVQIASAEARAHGKRTCLLYTSPSPRDRSLSRMPSSA